MNEVSREAREKAAIPTAAMFGMWVAEKTRNRDTDQFGHVNHAAMATLLEGARIELVFAPELEAETAGIDLLVVRLTLNFHKELRAPGRVRIGSRVTRIGSSSFDVAQAIFDGEDCSASAEAVCVLLDRRTRKPSPLTQRMRAHLLA